MTAETKWDDAVTLARKAVYAGDGRGMVGRRNRDDLVNRVARALLQHERNLRAKPEDKANG